MYTLGYDNGAWMQPWDRSGGDFDSVPTVISRGVGLIDVFGTTRGTGEVMWKSFTSPTWTGWVNLGVPKAATAASSSPSVNNPPVDTPPADNSGSVSERTTRTTGAQILQGRRLNTLLQQISPATPSQSLRAALKLRQARPRRQLLRRRSVHRRLRCLYLP